MLDIAHAMAYSALERRESRGAHQRLDDYRQRDDAKYLTHTVTYYNPSGPPRLKYAPVTITKSPPATRVYGGPAESAGASARKEPSHV